MSIESTVSSQGASSQGSRRAVTRREGLVLVLGSSLTIMGSVMVAPILPKLGAEFGPFEPRADVLVPLAITGRPWPSPCSRHWPAGSPTASAVRRC